MRTRILGLLLLFGLSPAALGGLEWETKEVKHEAKPTDESAEAVFKVVNKGDAPVTIKRVTTSCGCTVASFGDQPIPPGGSSEVRAVFKFEGRVGSHQKLILVETDPDTEKATLRFAVAIPKPVEAAPDTLAWQTDGPTDALTVRLTSAPGVTAKLVTAETTSPKFKVTLPEPRALPLEISVTPPSDGEATAALLMLTVDTGKPQPIRLNIPLMLRKAR